MKIGIDAHWLGSKTGGGETYIENLLNALSRIDNKNYFRVYITKGALKNKIFQHPSFVPSLIPESSIIRNIFSFSRKIRKDGLDLFHGMFPLPLMVYGRFVMTIFDITFENFPQFFTKRELLYFSAVKYLINKADMIIAISEYTRNEVIKHYKIKPEKIIAIPLGVEDIFRPLIERRLISEVLSKYKITEDYLLYTGRLNIRKNLLSLLKAYSGLRINEKLVIVGEKHYKHNNLNRLIKEFNLDNKIIFTGYIPKEDLPVLYSAAKGFIYIPLVEGFGLPALEAMACGTPSIVSNTSSFPEVVGDASILVDPLNIDEIRSAIVDLLRNSSLRESLSKKGIERAKLFRWERTAEKTMEIYKELVK